MRSEHTFHVSSGFLREEREMVQPSVATPLRIGGLELDWNSGHSRATSAVGLSRQHGDLRIGQRHTSVCFVLAELYRGRCIALLIRSSVVPRFAELPTNCLHDQSRLNAVLRWTLPKHVQRRMNRDLRTKQKAECALNFLQLTLSHMITPLCCGYAAEWLSCISSLTSTTTLHSLDLSEMVKDFSCAQCSRSMPFNSPLFIILTCN
jgi:hypothetical protein